MLAAYAAATSRIGLGTGVVPIYTRTPATMAMTAATLQEQSGGRLRLGLGVSHRAVVEGWHGQTIDKPVAEMREYVAIVRAILAGEPPPAGEKWQTSFALSGIGPYPELPIYVAALSPAMLRLAGEVADGAMLWLCNPEYIRAVVMPELRARARARGQDDGGLRGGGRRPVGRGRGPRRRASPRCAATCCPTSACPSTARCSSARASSEDIAAYDEAAARGDGEAHAGGDLRALPARAVRVGSPEDVRAGVARYQDAGATAPCVGPIAKTDFEATLRAAGLAALGVRGAARAHRGDGDRRWRERASGAAFRGRLALQSHGRKVSSCEHAF